ncbi:MAG TPA: hypothetical protein VMI31_10560 [Fimbriimonadaceae bacterium]|nr:hypothetical protein [Fimbriimonadaceae bacterium]
MFLCLRVDLDYVPWDSPDAAEFGHGEPAVFLRLLDFARSRGYRFHFFASERVLRALPSVPDAVLNEGHDLDWLCKHPESLDRKTEALTLFSLVGHKPVGLALKGAWPAQAASGLSDGFLFLSAAPGPAPTGLTLFPVETRAVREAHRGGASIRTWTDSLKTQLRDFASRDRDLTVVVRPQVLAKLDPHLLSLKDVLALAEAVGLRIATLRQALP